LRSHGIIRNSKSHWQYDIFQPGYNYRLSDINSALGITQLKKIKMFLKCRRDIYKNYKFELNNYKNIITFPNYDFQNNSSYHLILMNINFRGLKLNKNLFLKYMYKKNILCQFHYIPIYKFSLYRKKKFKLIGSEKYYNSTLSIPIYHSLDKKKQNRIIKIIKSFFKNC